MTNTLAVTPPSGLAMVLGVAYVIAGGVVAWMLARRATGIAASLGALVCWPLLMPLLSKSVPGSSGPLSPRISASVDALRATLQDPAAAPMDGPEDLDGLIEALFRADERLGLVDRLLASVAEPEGSPAHRGLAQSLADLRSARAAAAAEVEAVLAGLAQLRIQIGLRSLAGNTVPVRERLRDLRARLAAVDDLEALDLRNA